MKNLKSIAVLTVCLCIFFACEKEEGFINQTSSELTHQPQNSELYSENSYLVFDNYELFDSIAKQLTNAPLLTLKKFESKLNFKSSQSYRSNLISKADAASEKELARILDSAAKNGYFNKLTQSFEFPFDIESYACVLNPEGKVKIGKCIYKFEKGQQTVSADPKDIKSLGKIPNTKKTISTNFNKNILKSNDVTLEDVLLADGKKRCELKFKRDYIVLEDYIIVGGQLVWGTVGFKWRYYYRFYSYYRRRLYKSSRPTFFNWKTKILNIGGNTPYWHLDYSNYNPPLESSTNQTDVFRFIVYEGNIMGAAPGVPPTVSSVNISDFYSDYMSGTHGSLTIP